jgi:hypothetical protein
MLQLDPEALPVCSPQNNLQKRIKLHLFKNYIIPAFPNSPANGSDTNLDQGLIVFILIIKPHTKYMANRSRLGQISSIENNPPNHFCGRAI